MADDQHPFSPRRSDRQVRGLLRLLGEAAGSSRKPKPCRVLDLGCGIGRVLVRLSLAGHEVTGIDRDAQVLARCQRALGRRGLHARLLPADFRDLPAFPRRFDLVACLGNTFMTVADVDEAVKVLHAVCGILKRRGMFVVDDFPHEFWPQLTRGFWQEGISEDGAMQMVWSPGDSVFAIRRGDRINRSCLGLRDDDETRRLWCEGSLRLAAAAGGLSAPIRRSDMGLLVMKRL
jgi:SAM-dependent methyltransferase